MSVINKLLDSKAPADWRTDGRERKSYYVYFTGQNIFYALISSCLTTYFAFMGVDPMKIAGVMLVVKIWDAINDALFGVIFDAVKFKSGRKFIPWLRISLVLIPITCIAMFSIPSGISENAQIAWFAVTYLIFDTVYTLCDAPIYGIITSMTDNIDERNSMMSYKSIWGGVGGALAPAFIAFLVGERVGSTYSVAVILCSVVAFLTMIPACFNLKERYTPVEEEAFSVKNMLSYLFKNKYLFLFYIGFFFYSSVNYVTALNLLASYYLFNDSLFITILGIVGAPFSFLGSILVPKIVRKFDKMTVFRASVLATVILGVLMWVFGYKNPVFFIIFTILKSIPAAVIGVMLFMFTPDCAEYGKFKTGIEAKGITFAIQTFMVKLTGAISGALSLFMLGIPAVGWVNVEAENFEQLERMGVTQTSEALDAFWLIYALIPAIGYLVSYIIWRFYKLNDKDVQIMARCNAGEITKEEATEQLSRKY